MNNQTKDDEFISLSQQNKVKSVDMNQVFCDGAPPRGASPRGSPFLRARVYFAGIAKITRSLMKRRGNGKYHDTVCYYVNSPFSSFYEHLHF